jgi:protein phosphatase 1 regulatory subunit 7
LEGLAFCTKLSELYVSHNAISELECLDTLRNLSTLDVCGNRISCLPDLSYLSQLTDFWANDNLIDEFNYLSTLVMLPLETLYLERNPFAEASDYRQRVLTLMPNLTQLDADYVDFR